MGLIVPNGPLPAGKPRGDRGALSSALAVRVNETFEDDGGTLRTAAQGIAERLVHIALFGDDKDAVSASKVIFDRLVGRAPVQRDDKKVEIPRMVFALTESEVEDISRKAAGESEDGDYDGSEPVAVRVEGEKEMLL